MQLKQRKVQITILYNAPVCRSNASASRFVLAQQAEYNRKVEEVNREKYEEKIQDVERELLAVRQRMADLQKEKDQMNAETADRVQLRIKKQDLMEKEKSYKQM